MTGRKKLPVQRCRWASPFTSKVEIPAAQLIRLTGHVMKVGSFAIFN
jgi:hypothetical protein